MAFDFEAFFSGKHILRLSADHNRDPDELENIFGRTSTQLKSAVKMYLDDTHMSHTSVIGRLTSAISSDTTRCSFDDDRKVEQLEDRKESKEKTTRRDTVNTIPFGLNRVFGINKSTGFLNLTMIPRATWIFYAVSHVGVLFNYRTKEQRFMLGNRNRINNISCDSNCRWLVTCGRGKAGMVIIWNRDDICPINTLFEPHGNYAVEKVVMSPDAKYLITVGNEPKPIIKLWIWSLGKDEPDGIYKLDHKPKPGKCVKISVNMNRSEHFMVTFEHCNVFLRWENEELLGSIPGIKGKKNLGKYTGSTYLFHSTACVTVTDCGWAIMWGNLVYISPYARENDSNVKIFLKAVKLQTKTITIITSVNRLYATGDVDGFIKFYDRKLRILFWLTKFNLKPIVDIQFTRYKRKYSYEDIESKFIDPKYPTRSVRDSVRALGVLPGFEDQSEYYESLIEDLIPMDATLHRKPFIVRDFIILTNDAQVGFVNLIENKYEMLLKRTEASITSIDIHADCLLICVGFENGKIATFNYKNGECVLECFIPKRKEDLDNSITALRYSRYSAHLTCGTSSGHFWFLHPITLQPIVQKSFSTNSDPVLGIKFSKKNEFCAYYNAGMSVNIFIFDEDEQTHFKFVYRVIAHIKPIVDIHFIDFEEEVRLISIGEDKHLCEYDLSKCEEEGLVGIKTTKQIDQNAIPTAFVYLHELKEDGYVFLAENKYKFKILNDEEFAIQKTILSPTVDEPVRKIIPVPSVKHNEHQTKFFLFQTEKCIGIHLLPATGNPYEHVAMRCHSDEILDICPTPDFEHIFTIGVDDNCCIMWKVKFNAVVNTSGKGGKELEPFYGLIDGGAHGWLFKEMQDLFYYMQILNQGEDSPEPRNITDKIALTELPNLMRAVGFYPTEYELDNLIREAQVGHFNEKTKIYEITFEEFVKYYLNHKPAFGISTLKIKNCFNVLTSNEETIDRNDFIDEMCTKGEPFTEYSLTQCFSFLMYYNNEQARTRMYIEDVIPESITFPLFMKDVLGTEVDEDALRSERESCSSYSQSTDDIKRK